MTKTKFETSYREEEFAAAQVLVGRTIAAVERLDGVFSNDSMRIRFTDGSVLDLRPKDPDTGVEGIEGEFRE